MLKRKTFVEARGKSDMAHWLIALLTRARAGWLTDRGERQLSEWPERNPCEGCNGTSCLHLTALSYWMVPIPLCHRGAIKGPAADHG